MAYHDRRGSLWNKWDLHVHTPGTKKNDQYRIPGGEIWEEFCKIIHDSDVNAVGICDYFSVDGYFTFVGEYRRRYPDSCKLFLPNVELCTSYVVNKASEEVQMHLVFNPEIPDLRSKLQEFLGALKINKTDAKRRKIRASELTTQRDYEEATTTLDYIRDAFKETFGERAAFHDYMLIITAANNDGIRAELEEVGGKKVPKARKAILTDEIDKFSHAFFGGGQNVEHFQKEDRLESGEKIAPKAVFSGSDAHSFTDLRNYLGKQFIDKDGVVAKQVTWVKADLTFDGLKQALYEPAHGERYKLGVVRPDKKSPDHVIRSVRFAETDDLPRRILFNDNLCAIIGSRSSGKSALLAYLAYGVDAEAARERKPEGPAAAFSWDGIAMAIEVEWGGQLTQQGKVVYIPQNYLNTLSRNPEQITNMIKPVLFERYPDIHRAYGSTMSDIKDSRNASIALHVRGWFNSMDSISGFQDDLRDVGDKAAIQTVIEGLEKDIGHLRDEVALNQDDIDSYKRISEQIGTQSTRLKTIEQDIAKIQDFLALDEDNKRYSVAQFDAEISFEPSIENLPAGLLRKVQETIPAWSAHAVAGLQKLIGDAYESLDQEREAAKAAIDRLRLDNADLISRCKQNESLQQLIEQLEAQNERLDRIKQLEEKIEGERDQIKTMLQRIRTSLDSRAKDIADLQFLFDSLGPQSETIQFRMEAGLNAGSFDSLCGRFNRKEKSVFMDDDRRLRIEHLRAHPEDFLSHLYDRKLKVLYDQDAIDCAVDALLFCEEIRFSAEMENDTIGGFGKSSMTEGKQALFALTLLLSKDSDRWPLLIDQPEDDLDSRSIYDNVVPFLKEQKKIRQIIAVSHNANLVIGSDAEQIIVANQHGEDRKNKNARRLDYMSGALEYSKPRDGKCETILESRGIREHACDILDGGETAFEKRKNKYNL